jgi:choline dehydrogenase-like flavoprotein
MGEDGMAAVDSDLRVRGIEGLRVVDSSVLPSEPNANLNAPTIMLAERAADMIRGRPLLPPRARPWAWERSGTSGSACAHRSGCIWNRLHNESIARISTIR